MASIMSSSYTPEDIMLNVLSWLPVKSLVRFKSVCKSWLFITSDPKFIETHLTNSKKLQAYVPSSALLVKYRYDEKVKYLHKRTELYLVDSREVMVRLHLPPQPSMTRVVSCNGLVCLVNHDCGNIYIWNLSLKQYKILPAPNKRSKPYFNVVGFGYDSVFKDYKFLRILNPDEDKSGYFDAFKLEAEMYSANADSWKEIQLPEIVRSFWPHRPFLRVAFAIHGVLYVESVSAILSFDLHDEVFKLYEYTNSLSYLSSKSRVLDFEGSAAMVFSKSVGEESVLSLWTLEGVCGKVSWTKKFDLELDYKLHYYVCWNLEDGQFVLKDNSSLYLSYDYKKKKTRNLAWVPEGAYTIFNYSTPRALFHSKGLNNKSGE